MLKGDGRKRDEYRLRVCNVQHSLQHSALRIQHCHNSQKSDLLEFEEPIGVLLKEIEAQQHAAADAGA
jgi:hypothetical protein